MNGSLTRWSPLAGGIVWTLGVLVLSPSVFETRWAQALLLFASLVLVPLGLPLLTGEEGEGAVERSLLRIATTAQLPAALLLAGALLLTPGWAAAALAVPWLGVTGLLALTGLARVRRRGLGPLSELSIDAALIYVVVGSGWTILDRLGIRPLGFEAVIVLLTAIHFHYAGFVLPLLTGLALRDGDGPAGRVAGLGVIAGVPLVALGITATQLRLGGWLECLAAWVLAVAGMATAWLHLRLAGRRDKPPLVRVLWGISAVSLGASMVLAALYGSRFYAPILWLDIPWMRALHGTANALGFGLAGVLGWTLAAPVRSRPVPPGHFSGD